MKSFGLNDGRPNGEIVVEVDDNGAVTSAKNVITDTEYVGGGGDSDFSTVELTVTFNEAGYAIYVPNLFEEDGDIWYDSIIVDSDEYSSVLYKGHAIAYVIDRTGQGQAPTITVDGNAEVFEGGVISITGACTITIS